MTTRDRWINSAAGVVIGAVVLVLITAFLTGVVSSVKANHSLASVKSQLDAAHEQRDMLSTQINLLNSDNDALRSEVAALHKQNARLHRQNNGLQKQLRLLVTFLHSQGISVPSGVGGGSSGTSRPKRRRHHAAAVAPPPQGPGHSGPHPCAHSAKC